MVKNFLIVIEDKADTNKHIYLTDKEIISDEVASVCDYAVNSALFYGKHLAKNTNYKETKKALKYEEENFFTEEEINLLLPPKFRNR